MSCACEPNPCCTPAQLCGLDNYGLTFPSLVGPQGPPGGPGLYVENLAALRLLDATIYVTGYVANVGGNTTLGDGGGGAFYYSPASALTDNNGTIVRPANGVGRWLRIYDGDPNALWFGADRTGVADSSVAVANLVSTGAAALYFPIGTYRAKDITLGAAVEIYGDGNGTILKSVAVSSGGLLYSQKIFQATTALDFVTFRNLTFDGAGTGIGAQVSERPLILLDTVKKVRFENVTVTKYSGGVGATPAIKDWLFYAIVIRYATSVDFVNVFLTDNNYEQVLVYNNEASMCPVSILGCEEINTGSPPNSHTAFTTIGGVVNVSSWYSRNTRFSTLSIQLPKSATVTNGGFYDMYQGGVGVALDFGQGEWGPNNNLLLSNLNFQNSDEYAISTCWANNVSMNSITVDTTNGGGIKCYADYNNGTFVTRFPDWTPPTFGNCYGLRMNNVFVYGIEDSGGVTGRGIWIGHSGSASGQRYIDVQLRGVQISTGVAPNDTSYSIVLDGVQDALFTGCWLNYGISAFRMEGPCERVKINDKNTFASNQTTSGYDIVAAGAITVQGLEICRNDFLNFPLGGAYNVIAAGATISGLLMLDNKGLHPRLIVSGVATAVIRSTRDVQLSAAPSVANVNSAGIGDVFYRVPTAGQPEKHVATVAGWYHAALAGTGGGTIGQYQFTADATGAAELTKGAVVTVGGGGVTAATVLAISGTTIYIDKPMAATVVAQALTVVNPTFIATANMA